MMSKPLLKISMKNEIRSYEIAQQLIAKGKKVDWLVLFDTYDQIKNKKALSYDQKTMSNYITQVYTGKLIALKSIHSIHTYPACVSNNFNTLVTNLIEYCLNTDHYHIFDSSALETILEQLTLHLQNNITPFTTEIF